MRIKNKLIAEYRVFRKEVTWVEYAFWWIVRIIIIYALIKSILAGDPNKLVLRLSAKLASSFFLPVVHVFPRKVFLARISYRVQTIAAIMLLLTAVFGQYRGFYNSIEWYDAYLHVFGCFVFVFGGYELAMALKRDRLPLSPVVAAVSGFGLSFFFAVGWEIFEFICDTLIEGANSQNWMNINSEQLLAILPSMDPRRYALLDTMSDLIFGTVGSILGGFALFLYMCYKNKDNK